MIALLTIALGVSPQPTGDSVASPPAIVVSDVIRFDGIVVEPSQLRSLLLDRWCAGEEIGEARVLPNADYQMVNAVVTATASIPAIATEKGARGLQAECSTRGREFGGVPDDQGEHAGLKKL